MYRLERVFKFISNAYINVQRMDEDMQVCEK